MGQILRACATCGAPFTPRHARHRHCARHEPHGNAHRSPTTRNRPSSSAERARLREQVLGDGMPCAIQLPGCEGLATRMDHTLPAADGGPTNLGNLRPACDHCNSVLGGQRAHQAAFPEQGTAGGPDPAQAAGSRDRPPGYTRLA